MMVGSAHKVLLWVVWCAVASAVNTKEKQYDDDDQYQESDDVKYAVWVVTEAKDGSWTTQCSGSLMTPLIALTAANCHVVRNQCRVRQSTGAWAAVEAARKGLGAMTLHLAERLPQSRPVYGELSAMLATRSVCHTARSLPRHPPRLRILELSVYKGDCRNSTAGAGALCLRGGFLCANDLGAGVVCEGKLRAVAVASDCGKEHPAIDLLYLRPFLHCAITMGECHSIICNSVCADLWHMPVKKTATTTAATTKASSGGKPIPLTYDSSQSEESQSVEETKAKPQRTSISPSLVKDSYPVKEKSFRNRNATTTTPSLLVDTARKDNEFKVKNSQNTLIQMSFCQGIIKLLIWCLCFR